MVPNVNTTPSELVSEIRAEIARQKLTAANVSRATDISRASLSRKLSGTNEFTVKELFLVSAVLGVPFSEFLRRAEQAAA